MENLIQTYRKISDILEANDFGEEAKDLATLFQRLLDMEGQNKDVIHSLNQRTHIRWYGDLNIKTIDHSEWTRLLEKFSAQLRKLNP